MTERQSRGWAIFSHILLLLMSIILLYMTVTFVRQVRVSHQQRQQLTLLQEKIRAATDERVQLEQSLQEAQGDAAVEKWARSVGWSRPGEVLVVPIGGGAAPSPEVQPIPEAGNAPGSTREAWWDLFFGAH
jgi:cell division protein FtsB